MLTEMAAVVQDTLWPENMPTSRRLAVLAAPIAFHPYQGFVFLKRTVVLLCPHRCDGTVLIKQGLCEQFLVQREEEPPLQRCESSSSLGWRSAWVIKELEELIWSRQTMNCRHFWLCWG